MIKTIIAAFSLLSRIPMPNIGLVKNSLAWAYPLVGLVLGAGYYLAFTLLTSLNLAPELISISLILLFIFSTGALHFDGLADLVDGVWGKYTVAERLAVMKDSRLGSYGALALILALLSYYSLFNLGQAQNNTAQFAIILLLSSILSRSLMALVELFNPRAKTDGLLQQVSPAQTHLALPVLFILIFSFGCSYVVLGGLTSLIIASIYLLLGLALSILFRKKLGGITGDCLGATQLCSEIILLSALFV